MAGPRQLHPVPPEQLPSLPGHPRLHLVPPVPEEPRLWDLPECGQALLAPRHLQWLPFALTKCKNFCPRPSFLATLFASAGLISGSPITPATFVSTYAILASREEILF